MAAVPRTNPPRGPRGSEDQPAAGRGGRFFLRDGSGLRAFRYLFVLFGHMCSRGFPRRATRLAPCGSGSPTTRLASCGSIEGRVLPKLSCTAAMDTACPIVGLIKLRGIMSS